MTKTKFDKLIDKLISELGSDFVAYKLSDYYKNNLLFFRDNIRNPELIKVTLSDIKSRNYSPSDKLDHTNIPCRNIISWIDKHKRSSGVLPGVFEESVIEWGEYYQNNKNKVDTIIDNIKKSI